jgi:hypothetical protein
VTTKYLAKFQSSRTITRPKIIGPERNVNLICSSSLYTHIPKIKSISPSIAKKKWWQLNIWPNFKVQWSVAHHYTPTYPICHHFFSLCFEILTWYFVYFIMISYRSSLLFVPVQWFLAELWPLDFEIWPNI